MSDPIMPKHLKTSLHWLIWLFWLIGVIIVLIYTVLTVGLYGLDWKGPHVSAITKIVPVPAGLVAGQPVWFGEFFDHVQARSTYNTYLASVQPKTFVVPSQQENRQQALTKIIKDQATKTIAKQFGIRIFQADIDQAFTAQLGQSGNQSQITKAIKTYYGWTPEEFKDEVIQPVVVREKIREKLSFDQTLNALQRRQAEEVLALVKKGNQSFEEIAKIYSEDSYAVDGGDMGFFGRGQQVQELDDAAFSLEPGQTSDLLHTKYGWHIIQVIEKREVDGEEQVRAREIFIAAPNVDEYIDRWLSGRVTVLVRNMIWDNLKGQVIAR